MPRLKFDLLPKCRDDDHWQTRAENDAWVRKCWANWDRTGEPTPCDCGYWADDWLVYCDATERRACRATAKTRLEAGARREHDQALAAKRLFPALPRCPMGVCYWCRQPIVHGQAKQRSMHDGRKDEPECRWLYELHTRLPVQQSYLLDRDGPGCKTCGQVVGRWQLIWVCQEHRVAEYAFDGPNSQVRWSTGLEVDHRIALAVAWLAFPDDSRRRWFFSPSNLRLLCSGCHKAKTQLDRAVLREAAARGPEWVTAEVLRQLADAALLAAPKGRT
jgi:5-methylcytosine-specific restriction endonuclease McrA